MDNQSNDIKIFEGNDDVVIPSIEQSDSEKLKSEGIGDAISGDVVKSMIIPEDTDIILPNYVIDFSNIKEVFEIQIVALGAMLNENGDTALYIYNKGEMQRLGMAFGEVLNRVLVSSADNLFNGECILYKNVKVGEKAKVVKSNDITKLRLSI